MAAEALPPRLATRPLVVDDWPLRHSTQANPFQLAALRPKPRSVRKFVERSARRPQAIQASRGEGGSSRTLRHGPRAPEQHVTNSRRVSPSAALRGRHPGLVQLLRSPVAIAHDDAAAGCDGRPTAEAWVGDRAACRSRV
jgi:hypothetical protein